MAEINTRELEATVSTLVKFSQSSNKRSKTVLKPCWWPKHLAFQYPIRQNKRSPKQNGLNWREILHSLISKYHEFYKMKCNVTLGSRVHINSKQLGNLSLRKSSPTVLLKSIGHYGTEASSPRTTTTTESYRSGRVSRYRGNSHLVGNLRRNSTSSSSNSSTCSSSTTSSNSHHMLGSTAKQRILRKSGGDVKSFSNNLSAEDSVSSSVTDLTHNSSWSNKFTHFISLPIVNVVDVIKTNSSIITNNNNNKSISDKYNCDNWKTSNPITRKNDFMSYFNLSASKPNSKSIVPSQNEKVFTGHHPLTLFNCPNVPFSSNLGIKMIKDRPKIDQKVFAKRLERVERNLRTDTLDLKAIKDQLSTGSLQSPDEQIAGSSKHMSDSVFTHFYVFPSRNNHRIKRLTPKAEFLLRKYCRPCFVRLNRMSTIRVEPVLSVPEPSVVVEMPNINSQVCINQKENLGVLREPKILLTKTVLKPKTVTIDSDTPVSKALTPRNENCITDNRVISVVSPIVILRPLVMRTNKNNHIPEKKHLNKITKPKVQIYKPRRLPNRSNTRRNYAMFFQNDL